MLKRGKTLKIALLLTVVYVAFMAVLLTGVSSAKYVETRMAYTNFGAASFNTVIVNKNVSDSKTKYTEFDVFEAPVQLSQVSGYRPGMTYNTNTAREIPFTIANGANGTNASDATVEYKIYLCTTGNLPLKYTLKCGEVTYTAGERKKVENNSEIMPVVNDESGNPIPQSTMTWYKQGFYLDNTLQNEASFEIEGGKLVANDYTLIVEWPVAIEGESGKYTNDVSYMKEVELLELFVTVSSKNMLETEGYISGEVIQIEPGTGILILDEERGNAVHTLDYRAFDNKGEYTFVVENGVGKVGDNPVKHKLVQTQYNIEIEVPYTIVKDPEAESFINVKDFGYTLKTFNEETKQWDSINMTPSGYRLYDVLYGKGSVEPTTLSTDPTEEQIKQYSASDSQYELYKVYNVNIPVNLDNTKPDEHQYKIVLTGNGTGDLSKVAFANKIDIIVNYNESGSSLDNGGTPQEGGEAGG